MNDTRKIRISTVKFGQRFRKDLGDLEELAESIREHGLMQPIGITKKKELTHMSEQRILDFCDLVAGVPAEEEVVNAEVDTKDGEENMHRGAVALFERLFPELPYDMDEDGRITREERCHNCGRAATKTEVLAIDAHWEHLNADSSDGDVLCNLTPELALCDDCHLGVSCVAYRLVRRRESPQTFLVREGESLADNEIMGTVWLVSHDLDAVWPEILQPPTRPANVDWTNEGF